MTIGKRIRDSRKKAKMSQEALAKAIGSTKQAVYKYESGIVTNIPMDKIAIMAQVLGVSPAYLMGWEPKREIQVNLSLFDGKTEDEREIEKKLLALYDKIEDKEGLIKFMERLSALSVEQQKFVFENLLQGR